MSWITYHLKNLQVKVLRMIHCKFHYRIITMRINKPIPPHKIMNRANKVGGEIRMKKKCRV